MFSYMKREPGFYRQVAVLAAPIVLQNLITSTLGMADTFMVGMLGEVPMAAVTLANIPLFVVQMLIFGMQSGSSVLMSQYWGKQDLKAINRVMGVAMWAAGLVTAVFVVVMVFWPVEFLSLFGNEPEVIRLAAEYGQIAVISYAFAAITMIYVTAYRSMEKPQLGLYILVSSMLINTFLNWVFIFGNLGAPAMGVRGAALATAIARFIELMIVVLHMAFNRFFRVELGLLLRPGREMAVRFARYGSPVVANETMWGVGSSVFPTIMGHMDGSTEILAAYTIAGNMDKIGMVVSFGLAATAAVIIGREVGAGRSKEVQAVGMALNTLALLCGVVVGILLLVFACVIAPALVYPLFQLSARAGTIATVMMIIQGLVRPLRDYNSVTIVGVLRGGGDVRAATLIDVCPLWLVAIPLAALCGLVLKTDIIWVYIAMSLEHIVKCGAGFCRMRTGRWIRDLTAAGR